MIYNLPQNSSPNNTQQNFGFNIRVVEAGKILRMNETDTFRHIDIADLAKLEEKADRYLPSETIFLYPKKKTPMPYESFDVDVLRNGKKVESLCSHYARELVAFLKKAANPHTNIHSKLFYDGEKSPQTIARVENFNATVRRPLRNSRAKAKFVQ